MKNIKKNKKKKNNKKKEMTFNLFEVIVVAIVGILFGAVIGGVSTISRSTSMDKDLKNFNDTYKDITSNYYKKIDKKELVNAAIEGMVNYLGDPYSSYMDDSETEDFNKTVNGQYKGIGITVTMLDSYPVVLSVFEDTPAAKAGLKEKDIIIKVNDKSTKDMKLDDVVDEIKKNYSVYLTVLRDDKEKNFTIKLSTVDIPSVSSKTFEIDDNKIGYINISIFSANTYKQFKKALTSLEKKKIESLIIDVRDNPGGQLTQVTDILSLFMNKKKVLYQIKADGKKTKVYSKTDDKRDYDIVVLINGNSASASEILAGAIKESYKGTIVGTKSYGKGTVQKEYSLPNGSSIKYTTEEWLTPNGNSINNKGIKPTIEVELGDSYKEEPTVENDNQLQKAFEILKKTD